MKIIVEKVSPFTQVATCVLTIGNMEIKFFMSQQDYEKLVAQNALVPRPNNSDPETAKLPLAQSGEYELKPNTQPKW